MELTFTLQTRKIVDSQSEENGPENFVVCVRGIAAWHCACCTAVCFLDPARLVHSVEDKGAALLRVLAKHSSCVQSSVFGAMQFTISKFVVSVYNFLNYKRCCKFYEICM